MNALILSNNSLELSNTVYKDTVKLVWKEAEKHLEHTRFQHFTDHSIHHSKRISEYSASLLDLGSIELNEDEKIILMCAIALHDIGMITDKYIPDKNLDDRSKLEKIRENHNEYSYNYIKENYEILHLNSLLQFVDEIATVAKNHRKTDLYVSSEIISNGNVDIRLRLLSAILRLSDCLDYDFNRVNMNIYNDFNMEIKSKALWFCNYYVKSIRIKNKKINITFRFPEDYKNNVIENCIINYIKTDIGNQIDGVYDILAENGIVFHRDSLVMSKTYNSILKMMEDDVCDYFTLNFSENIPTESNSAEQTIKQKIQIIIPDLNKPENIPIESNSEIQTIESKEETFDFSNKWEFEQEVTRLITSDLKAAIKFINDGISFYQNEKKEDVKEILAECYKLKSEAYREIEGNGNKLLAVFSNIAYSTLKEN